MCAVSSAYLLQRSYRKGITQRETTSIRMAPAPNPSGTAVTSSETSERRSSLISLQTLSQQCIYHDLTLNS